MHAALVGKGGDAGDPASAHFLVDGEIAADVGHLGHLLVLVRAVEVEVVRPLEATVVDVQMMDVEILVELARPELTYLRTALRLSRRWPGRCGRLRLDGALGGLVLLGEGVEVPLLAHI